MTSPIPPARRTLIGLFADPVDGRLLTMDSTARFFTGRLRDFCLLRDQVCRLAGGRIREVDHRDEAHRHGETTARNGQSLSWLSHRIKDHPAITSRIADNDTATGPRRPSRPAGQRPTVQWQCRPVTRYTSTPPAALGPGARPDPQHWTDQADERQAYKEFIAACDAAA